MSVIKDKRTIEGNSMCKCSKVDGGKMAISFCLERDERRDDTGEGRGNIIVKLGRGEKEDRKRTPDNSIRAKCESPARLLSCRRQNVRYVRYTQVAFPIGNLTWMKSSGMEAPCPCGTILSRINLGLPPVGSPAWGREATQERSICPIPLSPGSAVTHKLLEPCQCHFLGSLPRGNDR